MRSTLARPHVGQLINSGVTEAQSKRAEEHPSSLHLFDRIIGKGDAHGITDALFKQYAQTRSGFMSP